MRKYYFTQLSSRWFEAYLYSCGIVLNGIAAISFAGLVNESRPEVSRAVRAKVELEDARMCTRHLGGRAFVGKGVEHIDLRMHDGGTVPVEYKSNSTYGRTRSGSTLEMVRLTYTSSTDKAWSWIFFEVDPKGRIQRCIQTSSNLSNANFELDCLASRGDYLPDGSCRLTVNMPSDCQTMGGSLGADQECTVPRGGKVLRASVGSSGLTCSEGDCKNDKESGRE